MKKLALACALTLSSLAFSSAAQAASITYTFTGASGGPYFGTSFTYVAPGGFLSFDTGKLAPTSATDLIVFSTDDGPITAFEFVSSTDFIIFAPRGYGETGGGVPYNLNTIGIQNLLAPKIATLDIELTNPSAVTPEPSSLILLGTGAIGILGTVRRRFLRG